jgi:NADPH2:quinone reductase
MRAVLVRQWTAPEGLEVVDMPRPEPGPGEVLIRVRAAALSFALSLLIAGKYQRRPSLPFIPGNTAAGEIVGGARDGERVVASTGDGALAEYVVAHPANVYPIPAGLDFARATALNTAYNSTAAALTWPHVLRLAAGETLLVHGAAGGVGSAACEIGRLLGARVIATASSAAKRDVALACGAHAAIAADAADLKPAVMELTGGIGVNAVLDPVGGALFTESLRCLAPEGRICPIGFAGGAIPDVPVNLLLVKNIAVTGLNMGHYKITARDAHAARVQALFARLGAWFEQGLIAPRLAACFPPERIAEAFACVLDRDHIGHVVVVFGDQTTLGLA